MGEVSPNPPEVKIREFSSEESCPRVNSVRKTTPYHERVVGSLEVKDFLCVFHFLYFVEGFLKLPGFGGCWEKNFHVSKFWEMMKFFFEMCRCCGYISYFNCSI